MSIHQAYFIHYTLLLIVFTYLKLKKKKKALELQRECSLKEIDCPPWRSPPVAMPALPKVCGLGAIVPADALSSHVELP